MRNVYNILNDSKENIDDIELVDFNKAEEEKYMKNFKDSLQESKVVNQKHRFNFTKTGVAVASLAICAILATGVYANDIAEFISKKFDIKGVAIVEDNQEDEMIQRDILTGILLGKIYDKDGNLYTEDNFNLRKVELLNSEAVAQFKEYMKNNDKSEKENKEMAEYLKKTCQIYDKDGKEIMSILPVDAEGNTCSFLEVTDVKFGYENLIEFEIGDSTSSDMKELTEEEAKEFTAFELLLPTYLPEGVNFEKAERLINETEEAKNYIFLNYSDKNGKCIVRIHERAYSEERGYETGGKNPEYVKVQGEDAILTDASVYVTLNNVICEVCSDDLSRDELMRIAESLSK